ncbi:energy-coupling factor transporter transmembrane protein EcfT [Lachnospiraceae bacterium MD329]|nr:energy-coupling factor transporter transmembrane protein EcfT [Lachnospiraceae bacterium MD329]
MNEFKNYHPLVNFIYFAAVILFSMFLMNPIMLVISLVCAAVYAVVLNGARAVRFGLLYLLPMMFIAAAMNPLFNHAGVTVIAYFPNGNPLTLESVVYGIAAAVMIAAVICYFSAYNKIMTSDKFIYLFGRAVPSMSLILSMSMRFVPRFKEQFMKITAAQKCIGRGIANGSVIQRVKNGITILSVMMTYALENSIETADCMKSRGYGHKNRTSFSLYRFSGRDKAALVYTLILSVYVIAGTAFGAAEYLYFPNVILSEFNAYSVSVFTAYFMLCAEPIFIEIMEAMRWKRLKSRL